MLEIGFESDYHGNNAYMKAQNNEVLQNFDFHLLKNLKRGKISKKVFPIEMIRTLEKSQGFFNFLPSILPKCSFKESAPESSSSSGLNAYPGNIKGSALPL